MTDRSFFGLSCRMEIQRCRRECVFDVGFMDPSKINRDMIFSDPEGTYQNLFKFVDRQNWMDSILLPYNYGCVPTLSTPFYFLDFSLLSH